MVPYEIQLRTQNNTLFTSSQELKNMLHIKHDIIAHKKIKTTICSLYLSTFKISYKTVVFRTRHFTLPKFFVVFDLKTAPCNGLIWHTQLCVGKNSLLKVTVLIHSKLSVSNQSKKFKNFKLNIS